MLQDILIFAIAFVAAGLSSMSGGGAGVILFPVLLSMGVSYPLVAAVSSVNSAAWVLPAARNYLKGGRKIHWPLVAIFSIVGLIGCYAGVIFAIDVNQRILAIVVGIIIVFLAVYTYFRKGFGLSEHHVYSRFRQAIAWPFALVLGFYETVFGSANGIMFTSLTVHTNGFDFKDGLAHYYLISFSWALFAAILFIQRGYYDIPMMIFAATGSVAGAYLGSRHVQKKGNKFIKLLFVIIGGLLGLKMIFGL